MVSDDASPPTRTTRPAVARRLVALAVLSAGGGLAFLPFLAAGSHEPISRVAPFAAIVTVVATVAAWPGLRCADAVGLRMPLLRRLDRVEPFSTIASRGIMVTLVVSAGLGGIGLAALRLIDAPPLPGGPTARALSTLFAAGPLEVVLHLGIMSVVIWLAHGRRWIGILVAAVCLVGFHLTGGALQQPPRIIVATVLGNGTIGLALGWIYAAYGFECVVLGHAVAHLITVLGGA